MRIQTIKNSEVFDAYSAIMSRYMKKRAGSLLAEIPSLTDELLGASSRAVSKASIENVDDFLVFWKELFNSQYDTVYKFVDDTEKLINEGLDPRLSDPIFIRNIIEQLTAAKSQAKKALEHIEPPKTSEGKEVFEYLSSEMPDAIDEVIEVYTKQFSKIEDAASAAAAKSTERAVGKGVSKETQEVAGDVGAAGAKESISDVAPPAAIVAESAAKATEKLTSIAGEQAKPVITEAVNDVSDVGQRLGMVEGTLEALQEQGKQTAGAVGENAKAISNMTRILQDSIRSIRDEAIQQISRSSDEVAEAAGNAAKIKEIEETMLELAQESRKGGKENAGSVVRKSMVPENAKDAFGRGYKEWIQSTIANGGIIGALKIGGKIAIVIAAGYGLTRLYRWLFAEDERVAAWNAELTRLQQAISAATAAHSTLQFNNLSAGDNQNKDILAELRDNKDAGTILQANNFSDPNNQNIVLAAGEQLDELNTEVKEFLGAHQKISADLISQDGWSEALAADRELMTAIGRINIAIQKVIDGATKSGGRESQEPVGSPEPSASGPIEGDIENQESILDIYGEKIDISGKPAGFRSAAPRMAQKLLKSPYGMAFIDPDNIWGGFIRKTGRPQVDYLNALGYLYKEGVYTPAQLRRFMRHALSPQDRRRYSGWRNAIKHYKRSPFFNKTSSNILINKSLVKESTNRSDISVRKMADQYSNKYISDAISGLSDQYAKSYYAGLKSQYNTNAAKTRADYKDLYEVHGGKGSDLVQEAHPKAVVVSDSMGNGGLVENLLEQKSHSEGVARSAPTGNFRGKHANLEVIEALNKIANQADEAGFFEVSDLIDSTITTILNE